MIFEARRESVRYACMHVRHSGCFARNSANYVPLSIMACEADKSDTQKPRSHELSTTLMAIGSRMENTVDTVRAINCPVSFQTYSSQPDVSIMHGQTSA